MWSLSECWVFGKWIEDTSKDMNSIIFCASGRDIMVGMVDKIRTIGSAFAISDWMMMMIVTLKLSPASFRDHTVITSREKRRPLRILHHKITKLGS